jgi:hypothetical protein
MGSDEPLVSLSTFEAPPLSAKTNEGINDIMIRTNVSRMEKLFFLFTDILLSFSDNPKSCNPFHFVTSL